MRTRRTFEREAQWLLEEITADGLGAAQSSDPERNCSFNQNIMVSEHSYEGLMGWGEVELKISLE